MSTIYHPETGLDIGDPSKKPLTARTLPTAEGVRNAFSGMIVSASGFRKVFAAKADNARFAPWVHDKSEENSLGSRISPEDVVLTAGMARSFGEFMLDRAGRKGSTAHADIRPALLLGIDTRPTGPAIADVAARVLLGMGFDVRYLFVVPAPEIMAYAKHCGTRADGDAEKALGFVYVSASHNPPGHNGVKFGADSGGVLSGQDAARVISSFKEFVFSEDCPRSALELIDAAKKGDIERCYSSVSAWKRRSRSAYTLLSHEILTAETAVEKQDRSLGALAESCGKRPVGIVAELNGSARCVSIDEDWLGSIGVKVKKVNDSPGIFAHRIVPEGDSLVDCTSALDEARSEDREFSLGYTPDCDGDRGNLVFFDAGIGRSRPLQAQEVFALSCLSELSSLALKLNPEADPLRFAPLEKTAVAVNDATSMRIDYIAARFGAKVFRAETGEANVVELADRLRSEGWKVRILGEGSNGGNITYPGRVRDPLSTLGAMIKLLRLYDKGTGKGLFDVWRAACGRTQSAGDFDLSDVIESLPAWATTSAFEPRAALRIATQDKAALKSNYEKVFLAEWASRAPEVKKKYGISSWRAFASIGSGEREIADNFGASAQGGLRIVFYDDKGEAKAFLWARASGTEPVFRIMADVSGGTGEDELFFHGWQADMFRRADLL